MSAAGSSRANFSSLPSSSSTSTSRSSQTNHVANASPSTDAGVGTSPNQRKAYMKASSVPQPRSPTRFAASLQPPLPPQQEISEKVRDAFEDLELSNIAPAESVYCAQQQSSSANARARSRSREHSRGRQLERVDRTDREWDEKRGFSQIYGNTVSASGPSNTRPLQSPQEANAGTIQAPVRSSSLTSASFSCSQMNSSGIPVSSAFVPPPPYSSHAVSSSAVLPSYPNNYSSYSSSVRRMLLVERIRPWLPFLAYAATMVGFAVAIAFYREEVFGGLDELAQWLKAEEETGYAVMFFLIFLTCIRESTISTLNR